VKISVEGNEVVIRFALDGDEGISASGKSRVVASTHGNIGIPGTNVKLGINAYVPIR
jgi:hypothetical protein